MNPALTVVGDQLWQRIGESMDRIELRLRKAVNILESTSIPFAIVGGNAVRVWVAQVDPRAVRATNDVDILIRPEDLEQLKLVMAARPCSPSRYDRGRTFERKLGCKISQTAWRSTQIVDRQS
jgi:hypothetical protein